MLERFVAAMAEEYDEDLASVWLHGTRRADMQGLDRWDGNGR